MDRCECAASAFLAQQALCLSHFIRGCYDQLDRMDPRGQKTPAVDRAWREARNALEECSDQTLRICLSGRPLNNLERGRLLDILLWAGELHVLLNAPRGWRSGVERASGEARSLAAKTG